jgi:ribosomal protein L5
MNRFNFYHQIIFSRDFLLKTNGKNIMKIPSFSKIILNTSIKASHRLASTSGNRKTSNQLVTTTAKLSNQEGGAIKSTDNLSALIALELLCGQKLKKTRSKRFIAAFKLKKNELIASKVSLRKIQMFNFFEKLNMIILPKLKDFQGFVINNNNTNMDAQHSSPPRFISSSNHIPVTGNIHKIIHPIAQIHQSGSISFGIQNLLLFPELENHYELFESIAGFQITIVPKMHIRRQQGNAGDQATHLNSLRKRESLLLFSGNQLPF